jgi:hypothetical protein
MDDHFAAIEAVLDMILADNGFALSGFGAGRFLGVLPVGSQLFFANGHVGQPPVYTIGEALTFNPKVVVILVRFRGKFDVILAKSDSKLLCVNQDCSKQSYWVPGILTRKDLASRLLV